MVSKGSNDLKVYAGRARLAEKQGHNEEGSEEAMTNDDSVYRYGGNEAIMVRNEIWGTRQAADELNRLTHQLTAALATVEKCKHAAENAIDHAENAMDQGDADEAFARCSDGLRAVAAAAKGGANS